MNTLYHRLRACVCLLALLVIITLPIACDTSPKGIPDKPLAIDGLTFTQRLPLQYAEQFAIDRYEDGYAVISVADGAKYLVVPSEGRIPKLSDANVKVIRQPMENVYMAATAAMGCFEALDSGSAVKFSGTKAEDWYIDYARNAMESGEMLYAGKYREPDYELLLSQGCTLAIESTMIEHNPEVKEKLTELGITVFVDYSSYEPHPLGRSEWIKVYGELLGKPQEAAALFEEQAARLDAIGAQPDTGKTVAFFYISSSGQAVTRRSGDYVSKMIELAGGHSAFTGLDTGNASSTVRMDMEQFYAAAKDADIFIYDGAIGGVPRSTEELIAKNALLANCKAVKENQVWCAQENLFQATMRLGDVMADFHAICSDTADQNPPQYLYKLESEGTP